MANYIARVELHKAGYDDYEKLHAEMQQRSFARTIVGSDNKTYQLPTGTYVARNTSMTLDAALNAAKAAANATGRTSWVIAADWSSASWNGLAVV